MISYNVLTVPDTAAFEKHISALNPRWLLFKDNLSYAAQIWAGNAPTSVIHRDWVNYQGDDDLSLKMSPRQWLDSQRALGSLNVWRYCCNENAFNEHTLAWLNEVIELNAQQNQPLRLVIGNFATGSYPPDGWKQPQAVKLLHYLDYNRQWLVLGCHEYFGATPTSGFYGGYPSNANIASNPTDAPGSVGLNLIPRDKWPEDTRGITLWHCGRFRFILKTCDELDIPYPRIVITEHGADDLGDIKSWLETLQKTAPYTSIRGWRSLQNQWRDWYGDDFELTYYNMLTYLDAAVYAGSPVEAQLIFGWGDSGGWEQFRVDNAPEFQRRLEMYAGTTTPPDDHALYGTLEDKTIVLKDINSGSLNLRVLPSTDSTILQQVHDGDLVKWSVNSQQNGAFKWHRVRHVSSDKLGYMAETSAYTVIQPIEPPPANMPDLNAIRTLVNVAKSNLNEAQAALKQVEDALK